MCAAVFHSPFLPNPLTILLPLSVLWIGCRWRDFLPGYRRIHFYRITDLWVLGFGLWVWTGRRLIHRISVTDTSRKMEKSTRTVFLTIYPFIPFWPLALHAHVDCRVVSCTMAQDMLHSLDLRLLSLWAALQITWLGNTSLWMVCM